MARQMKILVLDDHPEELHALLKNLQDAAEADPASFGGRPPRFEQATRADQIVGQIEKNKCPWDIIVADVFMPAGETGEPDAEHGAVALYEALEEMDESGRPFLVMTSNRFEDAAQVLTPLLRAQRSLTAPWADFYTKPANAPLAGGAAPLHSIDDWRQLVLWAIASHKDLGWKGAFLKSGFDEVATVSLAFQKVKAQVIRFASSKVIAVVGETGSGKERVAESLHLVSPRRQGEYRMKNLLSGPLTLVEGAIFGAVRGAYTGCDCVHLGLLDVCGSGTLFLDEFGSDPDLSATRQIEPKLRRVMSAPCDYTRLGDEEHVFNFGGGLILGGSRLGTLIEKAETDETWKDFCGRIKAIIRVPPLRDHPEDIVPLARHFLRKECGALKLAPKSLTREAERALLDYPWPENIRELEKTMSEVASLKQLEIDASDLRLRTVARPTDGDKPDVQPDPNTPHGMALLLRQFGNSQVKVAKHLGVTPNRVLQLMRQHRADPAFRAKFPKRH